MKDSIALVAKKARRLAGSAYTSSFDSLEWCAQLYKSSPVVRAAIDSTIALAGLTLIDRVLGYPAALRLAFLAPVWLAAQRGGRLSGTILVGLTSIALTLIDLATAPTTLQ